MPSPEAPHENSSGHIARPSVDTRGARLTAQFPSQRPVTAQTVAVGRHQTVGLSETVHGTGHTTKDGILTEIQYQILKKISPGAPEAYSGSAYEGSSKLATLLGNDIFDKIRGKVVIDFGCGEGAEAAAIAQKGARRVIGIDIRENVLETARARAYSAGVQNKCIFAYSTTERADIVISLDAFEHFANPGEILRIINSLLSPDGEVLISFGPTWYHPLGGHLFSVFPWAHLIFSEKALIRWRSTFKTDGATKFSEVAGGLNQMTIRRFERLIRESPFEFASLEAVPIKKLRRLHNRLTREFTSSILRCRLVKRIPN